LASAAQIPHLAACGAEGAIIGKALYTGALTLPDALAAAR
jgi:phosphoribosylformimino-5-aminoimidazole carboxamide ribonucleotide (ProFAR) isomerase